MNRLVSNTRRGSYTARSKTIWLALTIAAILVLSIVGLRMILMKVICDSGIRQMNRQNYAGAETRFNLNTYYNWFDRWVAPYNLGVAQYKQGKYIAAQDSFKKSLAVVPQEKRCLVALNLAWSHESYGDQLAETNQLVEAEQQYQTAHDVAASEQCEYDGKSDEKTEGEKQDSQSDKTKEVRPVQNDNVDSVAEEDNADTEIESEDRTSGSLEQQRQKTEIRNKQKKNKLDFAQQDQKQQEKESVSEALRLEQLRQQNQQAQQENTNVKDKPDGESNSQTGEPAW